MLDFRRFSDHVGVIYPLFGGSQWHRDHRQQLSPSERQRVILEKLVRRKLSPRELVERSRIVLMSAEGLNNAEKARLLGDRVDLQRIRRWGNRWAAKEDDLSLAETNQATDQDLMKCIESVLSDKPPSGESVIC